MNRLYGVAALLLLGLALLVPPTGAEGKDDKPPSIKMIMTKAHKGGDSLLAKAKGALADDDFAALSKIAKQLTKVGPDLSKNEPPKGEAGSWKKLTAAYTKNAKALEAAAAKKNAKAAGAALGNISKMCSACHSRHKG
jgi:hypothetical protein